MTDQELIKQFTRDFFKPTYNITKSNPEIGNLIVDIVTEIEKKYGVVPSQPEILPTPKFQKEDLVFVTNSNGEPTETKVIDVNYNKIEKKYYYDTQILYNLPEEALKLVEETSKEQPKELGEPKFSVNEYVKVKELNDQKPYEISEVVEGKNKDKWQYFIKLGNDTVKLYDEDELEKSESGFSPLANFKVGEYVYIKPFNDNEVYKIGQVERSKDKKRWIYRFKFDDGTTGTFNEDEIEFYKTFPIPEPKFKEGDNVLLKMRNGQKRPQEIIKKNYIELFRSWTYDTTDFTNQSEEDIELLDTSDSKFKKGDKVIASAIFEAEVMDVVLNPDFKEPYERFYYTIYIPDQDRTFYKRTELDLELDKSRPEPKFQKGQKVISDGRKGFIESFRFSEKTNKYIYDIEFEDRPYASEGIYEDMLELYVESKEEPKFKEGDNVILFGKVKGSILEAFNASGKWYYTFLATDEGSESTEKEEDLIFYRANLVEPKFKAGDLVASKGSPSKRREISKAIYNDSLSTPFWKYQTKQDNGFEWLEEELEFFIEPTTRIDDTSNTPLLKTDEIVKISGTIGDIGVITGISEDKVKSLWKYTIYNYSQGNFIDRYYTDISISNAFRPKFKVSDTIATKKRPTIPKTIVRLEFKPKRRDWYYFLNEEGTPYPYDEEDIIEYLPPARPEQKYHVGDYVASLSLPTVKREVTKCVFDKPTNKWEYYLDRQDVAFYHDDQLIPYEAPKTPEPTVSSSNTSSKEEPSVEDEIKALSQSELKQRKKDIEEAMTYFEDEDDEKIKLEHQLFYVNLYLEN